MGAVRLAVRRLGGFLGGVLGATRTISAILALLGVLGFTSVVAGTLSSVGFEILVGTLIVLSSASALIVVYTFVPSPRPVTRQSPESSIQFPARLFNDSQLRLRLKEVVYEYLGPDRKRLCHRKRFIVEASRDGLRSFPDRYQWTADKGRCEVVSRTPGFTIANQHKEEFWNYFDVVFPEPLQRGTTAEFTIEWQLYDEEETAMPFLSTMIDFETDRLTMTVVLPTELRPTHVVGHAFANYIHTLPVSTTQLAWNPATHSVVWSVDPPRIEGKYLIRWYW